MVFENEGNYIGIHNYWSCGTHDCGIHLKRGRAGVRLTKRPDQSHELHRSFRVMLSVFFQIIQADRGQEDKALRKPHPPRRRFCAFRFLRHLAY
jgi:hypothetical protein